MKRSHLIALAVVSIVLMVGGAFYAGNLLGVPSSNSEVAVADLVEKAKAAVPAPVFPPKPAGKEVMEDVEVRTTEQVPVTRIRTVNLGLGIVTHVPEISFETKTVVKKGQRPKFIDVTPEENAKWDTEVQAIRTKYEADVEAVVRKLVADQKQANAKASAELLSQLVQGVAVPLLTALAGLIGAIVTLLQVLRGPPDARPANRRPPRGARRN